jgi:cytochrome P450
MGFSDIMWTLGYYFLYFLVPFTIYFLYEYVHKPYAIRRYYKKFPNVYVSPYYVLLLGDAWNYVRNIMNNRIFYYHFKEEANEVNKYDFKLELIGVNHHIKLISYDSQKGVEDFTPTKIDRAGEYIGLGKMLHDSFGMMRSTPEAMHRRKTFMKLLSFNNCSKYIPIMLSSCQAEIGIWEEGKTYQGLHEMNMLTFGFFTLVMFGKDMTSMANKMIDFEKDDGTFMKMPLSHAMTEITKNFIEGFKHPITAFAPFLNTYELVNPFRRNRRNNNVFRAALRECVDEVHDKDSILKFMLDEPSVNNDEMFEDLIGFMSAGTETGAHTLATIFYHIKRKPEIIEKARAELRSLGFYDFDRLEEVYNYDNIQKLDYVNSIVKEALRIDSPIFETMMYKAYEEVTVAGVTFPKGTIMKKDLFIPHYDEAEYFKPREFIPERFDPESEYFPKPNSGGKARRPYSYIPFSYGIRACPGQSFSMLELKIAVAYLLTHIDYDVPQTLLDDEYVGWAVCTPYELPMTITKNVALGSK